MAWEYKTVNWQIAAGRGDTSLEFVYEAGATADAIRTIAERPRGAAEFEVQATIDDVLDEYGRDGWELVSAFPLSTTAERDSEERTTVAARYTLKRAIA